jgi:penicillin-binding protein 1A
VVVQALIATEDSRFFEHEGIDLYSIPRVVVKTLLLGDRSAGGGSTISQQLAKNLFGRNDYGALSLPVNKLKENITALKLEDVYSKEEIITLYLNTVSFGENVYGIKAAAYRYFGKEPAALTTCEAATLVGMLKANTLYNPRLYPEASLQRRNTVLALMVREGSLEPDELMRLQATPLNLNYRRDDGHRAPAPWFRAHIEGQLRDIAAKHTKADGTPYNLYTDGLRVQVTLHSKLQAMAEQALRSHMATLQEKFNEHWKTGKPWGKNEEFLWAEARRSVRWKRMESRGMPEKDMKAAFLQPAKLLRYTPDGPEPAEMTPLDSIAWHQMILQAAIVAIEAYSGKVLAYAGGTDFSYFPYDHVQARRQAGSTFKPFVYTTALRAGRSPCDWIENERITFDDYQDWSPENSGTGYGGYYTLQGGLAKSVNTIAARLMAEVGPEATAQTARRMGIASPLPNLPSIALGVADVSLIEMTTAYAAFANGGSRIEPWMIEEVRDSDGKVLYKAKPSKPTDAIDAYTAQCMRQMLRTAADSGTAHALYSRYKLQTPVGGKTGTTQHNADGWFIAITPQLAIGARVGGQSPLVRFRSTALGQGSATALPIVAELIRQAEKQPDTRKLLGRSFEPAYAYDPCPNYRTTPPETEAPPAQDESREERRERRKLEREEKKNKTPEEEERDQRWMNRLLEKLKRKEKQEDPQGDAGSRE